jgi:hypothetical protein
MILLDHVSPSLSSVMNLMFASSNKFMFEFLFPVGLDLVEPMSDLEDVINEGEVPTVGERVWHFALLSSTTQGHSKMLLVCRPGWTFTMHSTIAAPSLWPCSIHNHER